jgi:hypothetical protein
MVSEHLTINGFDSRVYLGAARAQAAAMRGVMGLRNQSRHTVIGNVTIDVRIQDSHTYIKIDTEEAPVMFFLVSRTTEASYIYTTKDLRIPPTLFLRVEADFYVEDAIAYANGYVVFVGQAKTGSFGVVYVNMKTKAASFLPLTTTGVCVYPTESNNTVGVVEVITQTSQPPYGVETVEVVVYEGVPGVEVSRTTIQLDTYSDPGGSSAVSPLPPVYRGSGEVVMIGTRNIATVAQLATYTAAFRACVITSTDYGRTWHYVDEGLGLVGDDIVSLLLGVDRGVGRLLYTQYHNTYPSGTPGECFESVGSNVAMHLVGELDVGTAPVADGAPKHLDTAVRVGKSAWLATDPFYSVFATTNGWASYTTTNVRNSLSGPLGTDYGTPNRYDSESATPTYEPAWFVERSGNASAGLYLTTDAGLNWVLAWQVAVEAYTFLTPAFVMDAWIGNLVAIHFSNRK